MVRRTSLIDRLARHYSGPIVSVIVLPGYGKTTLPAEWAERAARRR
jgi:ATP/maltotriose-dependent transcriptional regulator MalT